MITDIKMALHLMRKINSFNLLLSRGLICRHSSSSSGDHGDQGEHGNKSGQEDQRSKEVANKGFEESSAVEEKDDSTTTLPSLKEKEERQLAQIRKMYEGTGVEVIKHEQSRGITRREGVSGKDGLLIQTSKTSFQEAKRNAKEMSLPNRFLESKFGKDHSVRAHLHPATATSLRHRSQI